MVLALGRIIRLSFTSAGRRFASNSIANAATVVTTAGQPAVKSKSQQLREVRPDRGIVTYLDKLRIGFISKRKTRVLVAKKFTALEKEKTTNSKFESPLKRKDGRPLFLDVEPTPYPFKQYGSLIGVIKDKEQLPRSWQRERPEDSHLHKEAIEAYFQQHVKNHQPSEIAIIGRSNVGKSTLVNHLLRFDSSFIQKSSISDKPGETKHLHFYALGKYSPPTSPSPSRGEPAMDAQADNSVLSSVKKFLPPALILVDMPGYGFAFMGDEDKQRSQELMQAYLFERQNLKRLLLLLDARHGLKMSDVHFFATLGEQLKATKQRIHWKLQIVMTKCDLVDRLELARRIQVVKDMIYDKLPSSVIEGSLPVMAVSCWERKGLFELKKELAALGPNTPKPRPRKDMGVGEGSSGHSAREKALPEPRSRVSDGDSDVDKKQRFENRVNSRREGDNIGISRDARRDRKQRERTTIISAELDMRQGPAPAAGARGDGFVVARRGGAVTESVSPSPNPRAASGGGGSPQGRSSLLAALASSRHAEQKAVADKRLRSALKRHHLKTG